MARIPQLTATKLLDSDRIPNTKLVNFEAEALGSVGAALQDVGATLQQRQEQREAFKTENDYRKFQLDLSQGMSDYQAGNMPEGGIGFHDGFLKDVYSPKRDAFLKSVPPRLRERFETITATGTGSEFGEWSNRAATTERDENYRWSKEQIGLAQQNMANVLSMNPEQYDTILKSGADLIDSSTLPEAEKKTLRAQWETMAQVTHLNRMMEDDPEGVLKALGANPNMLSPTSQFDILSRAVRHQESRGNNAAISSAGAVGSHQVMPGTARDIAKLMGDTDFPSRGDPQEVAAYLLRPGMSQRYGEFYLKHLMKKYPGDLEAALIAYHSGPGAADKWLKAGRDDEVLGPVGQKYYKEVIARLPGGYDPTGSLPTGGAMTAGSAGSVKLTWVRDGKPIDIGPGNAQFDSLQPELVNRLRGGFASAGVGTIRIRSGFRDPTHNKKVGGAEKSQHLTGSAVDLDVTGMSHEQRVNLIRNLSAAGITGLGIGANSIHADIGGRRAWGYYGSGSAGAPIPTWAKAAIDEHLAGRAQPKTSLTMADRYSSLPYDKRQQFISSADTALTKRVNEAARVSAVDKVQIQSQMDNEIALYRSTGKGSGQFDETRISTSLGEDDYLKFVNKRTEAQRVFVALDGMREMDPSALAERMSDYEPNPRAADFESQQTIHSAIVKEAERITRQRANQPDKAALDFPDVKEAQKVVEAGIAAGKPEPDAVQSFVKLMIQRQKEFGVQANAVAPVPSEWAFQIGRSLSRIPEVSKDTKVADVRAAVAVQYNALKEVFGDYTDEVIIYALSEYKGLSKQNAEMITGLMQNIAAGGNPFKVRDAADAAQVESTAVVPPNIVGVAPGPGWGRASAQPPVEETADPDAEEPTPSSETILRVIGHLNSVDTPEEEALLVQQYGQKAVDAAKLRVSQGRQ